MLMLLFACTLFNADKQDSVDSQAGFSPLGCEDPQLIEITGRANPSGYVRCSNGGVNRVAVESSLLPVNLQRCEDHELDPADAGGASDCETDSDCGDGHCRLRTSDYGLWKCECAPPPCEQDSDCAQGEACMPRVPGNSSVLGAECRPASCLSPEDCESGECGVYIATMSDSGCFHTQLAGLACRTADSSCRGYGDGLSDCGQCMGEDFTCVPSPTSCD